jgi:hypothetical protein
VLQAATIASFLHRRSGTKREGTETPSVSGGVSYFLVAESKYKNQNQIARSCSDFLGPVLRPRWGWALSDAFEEGTRPTPIAERFPANFDAP